MCQCHKIIGQGHPKLLWCKAIGNFSSGIPGNMSFLYTIISSLDKCSYSARHNVKVHHNFVDSIETLKSLSRDISHIGDHQIRFRRVYQRFPSTNPVSPARRLMILHRTQQSTLFDITIRIVALCGRPTNTACLTCIECRPTKSVSNELMM